MLTIKAPIELKCTGISLRNDGFAERIRGNYGIMGAHVSESTLNHLLHTPPEILIADTGVSQVSNQMNVFAFHEEQQELINNVVNRILLSNTVGLTYQDRVYITDILHNIGIRDEKRFMGEVHRILRETENMQELTTLYMDHVEELRGMLQVFAEEGRSGEAPAEEAEAPERADNYLYQDILNRLKTGAVYQIFHNMNRSLYGDTLNQTEINSSEQGYIARELLISRFREMATGDRQNLTYRTENIYEEAFSEGVAGQGEKFREELTSAVLLEVLRVFDHAMTLRDNSTRRFWTDFQRSFYRSADQTLSRILLSAREQRVLIRGGRYELRSKEETERQEIELLKELFQSNESLFESYTTEREGGIENREFREFFDRALIENREYYEGLTEEEWQTEYERLQQEFEVQKAEETRIIESNTLERETFIPSEPGESGIEREELLREYSETDRSLLERESIREYEGADTTLLEEDRTETLEEEVERIERQNALNLERYREIRRLISAEIDSEKRVSDRERTIRESLRTLQDKEHLMELLSEYQTGGKTQQEKLLERIYALLPRDTVEIFRELDNRLTGEGSEVNPVSPDILEKELTLLSARALRGEPLDTGEPLVYREEAPEEHYTVYTEGTPAEPPKARHLFFTDRAIEVLRNYDRLIREGIKERAELRLEPQNIERYGFLRESLSSITDRERFADLINRYERSSRSERESLLEEIYTLLPAETATVFREMEERFSGEEAMVSPETFERELMLLLGEAPEEEAEGEEDLFVYREEPVSTRIERIGTGEELEEGKQLYFTDHMLELLRDMESLSEEPYAGAESREEAEEVIAERDRIIRESLKSIADRERFRDFVTRYERGSKTERELLLEEFYSELPEETAAIFREIEERIGGEEARVSPGRFERELIILTGPGSSTDTQIEREPLIYREEGAVPETEGAEQGEMEGLPAERRISFTEHMLTVLRVYERLLSEDRRTRELIERGEETELRGSSRNAPEVLELTLLSGFGGGTPVGTVEIRRDSGQAVVSLVHRIDDSLTEEDIMETISQYRESKGIKTNVVEEAPPVTEIRRSAPQTIINTAPEYTMTREQAADIARLIEQGVRRQLNTISNEVYTRLEKRLKSEKTRRGF